MGASDPQLAVQRNKPLSAQTETGAIWLLIILVLILLAIAVAIFGGQEAIDDSLASPTPMPTASETDQPARIYTVSYRSGVFGPTNLRIHAGDTVRFRNDGLLPIRIKSDEIIGFGSVGDIPTGSYFTFTFAAKGTFAYRNEKNTSETGTIIVR